MLCKFTRWSKRVTRRRFAKCAAKKAGSRAIHTAHCLAPTQPIYAGEGYTTQGGANLSGIAELSSAAITEAFDEPLTKDQVLAIAKLFIKA